MCPPFWFSAIIKQKGDNMIDYRKYIENKKFHRWAFDADPETEKYFEDYIKAHPEEKETLLRVKKEFQVFKVKNEKPSDDFKAYVLQKIEAEIRQQNEKVLIFRIREILKYAAVAVLFFAVGSLMAYFYLQNRLVQPLPESLLVKSASLNTTVYLAEGTQKQISNPHALIDFSNKGKLIIDTDTILLNSQPGSRNMVVVPYGKRANLKLQDKSRVLLNAGSRLIFPEQFDSHRRETYLVGEAFFDVTKDRKHPFFVKTSPASVKVLGTNFNVSAYPDNQEVTAFLKKGKVQMKENHAGLFSFWVDLKPNQKATLNKNTNEIKVEQAKTDFYELWKDGIIKLDNESVSQLVLRVEKYFNIKLRIKDQTKGNERMNGKLDLNKEMPEVFEYIEKLTHGKITKTGTGEYILD